MRTFYTVLMKHHRILLMFCCLLLVGASSLYASSFNRGIGAQVGQLSSAGLSFYQRLDATLAQAYTPSVGIGAGFGVEPVFVSHFSVPVSFGYGIFYTAEGSSVVDMLSISFLAQIGVRYRF